MDLSYPTALFWNYLTEQLGTPFAEPARGVDVIERFWRYTDGHDPDSVKYLRDAIHSFDAERFPGRHVPGLRHHQLHPQSRCEQSLHPRPLPLFR